MKWINCCTGQELLKRESWAQSIVREIEEGERKRRWEKCKRKWNNDAVNADNRS